MAGPQLRLDPGDLHHLAPTDGLACHSGVVGVDEHDELHMAGEQPADRLPADPLPGELGRDGERVDGLTGLVRVHRREQPHTGVERAQQLEGLAAAHLPDDEQVGPEPQVRLDEVTQRLPRPVAGSSVAAEGDLGGQLPRLLVHPHDVVGRDGCEQRVDEGRLPCARWAGHDHA